MFDNNNAPKKEHPNTYFVQNLEDRAELQRLILQDRMTTTIQGGLFPELNDLSKVHTILDVACGPGLWAIDVAQQYPHIALTGIDISQQMVNYARHLAEQSNFTQRVEFQTMDALRMLEFPDKSFDLVNMRCAGSFLRTWDWPRVIGEMLRVLKPGGIIRLAEPEVLSESNSPTLNQLNDIFRKALLRAGHISEAGPLAEASGLTHFLIRYGCQNIQSRKSSKILIAGTEECEAYRQNITHAYRLLRPFLQKWGSVTGSYDELYQQMLEEIQKADFYSPWSIVTCWGTKNTSGRM